MPQENQNDALRAIMLERERDAARMAVTMIRTSIENAITDYEETGDVEQLIKELQDIL